MVSIVDTTKRANCWSITINNPTPDDLLCSTVGWTLTGQHEKGEEGTPHFQGMLRTPQVRFSAVKRAFPRAHIEIARDAGALARYVVKEETRVAEQAATLNMFSAQTLIASKWDWEQFETLYRHQGHDNDCALRYVDALVSTEVESGVRALEFIAINPMWRSSWKKFWASIIHRHKPAL